MAKSLYSQVVRQNIRRIRYDIGQWRKALKIAENVDNPNRARLYDIYFDVLLDALLTSQMQNRKMQVMGTPFKLMTKDNRPSDRYTAMLQNSMWFYTFLNQLLDTDYWGHSLWEITKDKNGDPVINLIPRKHVKPQTGEVLEYEYDTSGVAYREMREYGKTLIETPGNDNLGLLNKAVPHILMKRFAQSCWSEFCEMFGMPMRTLKTNTSDSEMLNRADDMMRTMGTANYSIIDESEILEYAEANNSNGEVYKQLIALCNNEVSMLILGAILGQDTEHGTRGKEQVSFDILSDLVKADIMGVENFINASLLPALEYNGFLPIGLSFQFCPIEDINKLWAKARDLMPHYNVSTEWINDKFGIPVIQRENPSIGII